MGKLDSPEIYYILRSSRDNKGRRVLLRLRESENWFYPGEELSEFDVKIWNLNEDQIKDIEDFLRSDVAYARC